MAASFTLTEWALYAARDGGWTSWNSSFSGETYISDETGRYILYKVHLELDGYASLNSFTFTTRIHGSSNNPNTNLRVQLLDANPMVTSSYNVLGDATWSGTSPYGGISVQYNFTGLNLNTSKNYFLYITDNNTHATYQDYLMHAYAAISNTSYTENLPLSLSLSSASVTTGGSQVVTIGNGSGKGITVYFKYNGTTIASGYTSTGQLSISVTSQWFSNAGITTASNFTVSVSIDLDSTLYESFTVVAGSDMAPTVSGIALAIVQPTGSGAATYFPDTYIANISKCKVSATITTKAGATIPSGSVKLAYTGGSAITMTYNSTTGKYEGTTAALTNATTAFTVSVTDSRGLSGYGSGGSVSVTQYTKPTLTISSAYTYRCDSSGTQESGGAYWRAMATATYYSSLSGNSLLQFKVTINTGTTVNLTSGVQTAVQGGSLNQTTNYTLTFSIQDKISEVITKTFILESITRNVVIKRNSTGTTVGVGTTPTRAAGSAVELPLAGNFLNAGIPAQAFFDPYSTDLDGSSFGKDFLNVDQVNRHAIQNAATFFYRPQASIAEWSNAPATNDSYSWRGYRFVLWYSASFQIVVVFELFPYPGRIWSNFYNTATYGWTGWRYTSAVSPST